MKTNANKRLANNGSNERIAAIIDYMGVSYKRLAELTGIPYSTVLQISGNYMRFSEKTSLKICKKCPEISFDWILTGTGEMLVGTAQTGPSRHTTGVQSASVDHDVIRVPIINLDARGGFGANDLVDEAQYVTGMITLGRDYARDGDLAIPVVGDSMYPKYPPGSIIIIRQAELWREYIEYGAAYVVELTDGQRMLKNIAKSGNEDTILLESVNTAYAPAEVHTSVIMRLYRVILSIRRDAF